MAAQTSARRRREPEAQAEAVNVPTAAKILGIGLGTAWEAVKSGEIPSIRIRRTVRVPLQPLRKMLAGDTRDDA
ncbi:MAG: helix-turn-helix domain-containing protein [Rhodospirillales bacterium]|nr:helix-turn-helix domain-containing protein [Rhodospirillales bacterium]